MVCIPSTIGSDMVRSTRQKADEHTHTHTAHRPCWSDKQTRREDRARDAGASKRKDVGLVELGEGAGGTRAVRAVHALVDAVVHLDLRG